MENSIVFQNDRRTSIRKIGLRNIDASIYLEWELINERYLCCTKPKYQASLSHLDLFPFSSVWCFFEYCDYDCKQYKLELILIEYS